MAAAYLGTAAAFAVLVAVSAPLYSYFFLRCSTKLHADMLEKVGG